jgi:hypothetical protein
MNERPDFRTRLLADLFQDDWNEGPAAAASRDAAAWGRRRRSRRRLLLTAGTAGGMAALLLLSLIHPGAVSVKRAGAAPSAPAYQIVSDDELLADVSDRPLLALHEPGGARRILVLDNENP